jgi:hypothetical protein
MGRVLDGRERREARDGAGCEERNVANSEGREPPAKTAGWAQRGARGGSGDGPGKPHLAEPGKARAEDGRPGAFPAFPQQSSQAGPISTGCGARRQVAPAPGRKPLFDGYGPRRILGASGAMIPEPAFRPSSRAWAASWGEPRGTPA